jgi:hypothetical protein
MSDDTDYPYDGTDTTEKRVTITIEDCPLPVAEDSREEALADLEDAIGGLLHSHMEPTSITTRTGHYYVEIGDDCPRCGGTLDLRDYTYSENGAVAEANCATISDCGWRGRAVYRLIDLESGPVVGGESAVDNGDIVPSYHSY